MAEITLLMASYANTDRGHDTLGLTKEALINSKM